MRSIVRRLGSFAAIAMAAALAVSIGVGSGAATTAPAPPPAAQPSVLWTVESGWTSVAKAGRRYEVVMHEVAPTTLSFEDAPGTRVDMRFPTAAMARRIGVQPAGVHGRNVVLAPAGAPSSADLLVAEVLTARYSRASRTLRLTLRGLSPSGARTSFARKYKGRLDRLRAGSFGRTFLFVDGAWGGNQCNAAFNDNTIALVNANFNTSWAESAGGGNAYPNAWNAIQTFQWADSDTLTIGANGIVGPITNMTNGNQVYVMSQGGVFRGCGTWVVFQNNQTGITVKLAVTAPWSDDDWAYCQVGGGFSPPPGLPYQAPLSNPANYRCTPADGYSVGGNSPDAVFDFDYVGPALVPPWA